MAASLTDELELRDDGIWILRGECQECHVELLTEFGDVEGGDGEDDATWVVPYKEEGRTPSAMAIKMARACRRTCEQCVERAEAAREARKAARSVASIVQAASIPEELRGLQFEDMVRKGRRGMAISAAQSWSKGGLEKPGLFLSGAAGVGKTRLAATAAWARLQRGQSIRWVSVAKLLTNISRAYADTERRRALSVLTGLEALVLDDLDKVNPSEFGRQQLFTAIDERVQAKVPMIVTSNQTLVQIGDKFGDALMSRLAGHCVPLLMDGDDWRMMELSE